VSDAAKWAHLAEAPSRDARDPRVRFLADALWTAAGTAPTRERMIDLFVRLALALVHEGIRYKLDTDRVGHEDIAGWQGSPDRSSYDGLERGVDDCDAKGSLFCALCLARSIPAELVPVWSPDGELKHVAARVRIGGAWRHCEPTLRRSLLGERPEHVPTELVGAHQGEWLQ